MFNTYIYAVTYSNLHGMQEMSNQTQPGLLEMKADSFSHWNIKNKRFSVEIS